MSDNLIVRSATTRPRLCNKYSAEVGNKRSCLVFKSSNLAQVEAVFFITERGISSIETFSVKTPKWTSIDCYSPSSSLKLAYQSDTMTMKLTLKAEAWIEPKKGALAQNKPISKQLTKPAESDHDTSDNDDSFTQRKSESRDGDCNLLYNMDRKQIDEILGLEDNNKASISNLSQNQMTYFFEGPSRDLIQTKLGRLKSLIIFRSAAFSAAQRSFSLTSFSTSVATHYRSNWSSEILRIAVSGGLNYLPNGAV